MPPVPLQDSRDEIIAAVREEVSDQQTASAKEADIALLFAALNELDALLKRLPPDPGSANLLSNQINTVKAIQAGTQPFTDLGSVLANLYKLRQDLSTLEQTWLSGGQVTARDTVDLDTTLLKVISQTRQLLIARPDVTAIMDDLTAIKHLSGGPADAIAFHDFNVLQIAFKSVWLHAFDANLKYAAEQLFQQLVGSGEQSPVSLPPLDAVEDVAALQEFLSGLRGAVNQFTGAPIPQVVSSLFPGSDTVWYNLTAEQQKTVLDQIWHVINDKTKDEKDQARKIIEGVLAGPNGYLGRLSNLILEIGNKLNEPYAFDVFAPDTYNYGLMVTYRQKWEPGEYQAGDLAATIPLAPGETRKFTKKRIVKESIARKVAEKSSSARSEQSSETSRAESEIMTKATTATNFKMTTHGSFNIGIGSIDTTTDFGGNNELFSSTNKKAFHEATLKAAEEYRLERSMEVDTTSSIETEETSSGEISNPNNEITVTYLFYELQRRFKISEFLYRVRPVILVAQDVPAPHEIDESWLVQYQWILARVLLDESFHPALTYLTSGFAGDETSIEVIRANWQAQKQLLDKLEAIATNQLAVRDALRDALVNTALEKDIAKTAEMPLMAKVLTLGMAPDPAEKSADMLEAQRRAIETRLQYAEQAVDDAQKKLRDAASAFDQATRQLAQAMQQQYSRHIAIDQLRIHVKQNILYYMQAIWAHEPPDQRYFRLYKKPIVCPGPIANCNPQYTATQISTTTWALDFTQICAPGLNVGVGGEQHELSEVADLDNPLGFKGNYIIFPLIDECYLTTYMLTNFIDNQLGVADSDLGNFNAETFDQQWQAAANNPRLRAQLRDDLIKYITAVRRSTDEIIVPTGQLFIEALPGSHPLLEDFKLLHRLEDVRKARSEVRHAELENLRLASRLVESQGKPELLEDPDIEKKIIIEGGAAVVVGPNA